MLKYSYVFYRTSDLIILFVKVRPDTNHELPFLTAGNAVSGALISDDTDFFIQTFL